MQINGHNLSGAFIPQSYPYQGDAREPVIIDAEQSFELNDNRISIVETDAYPQQDIVIHDQQQAKFVRTFSTASPVLEIENVQDYLPREIQQYLQIANLELGQPPRLIDERV